MTDKSPVIFLTRHCKTAWNLTHRIQGSIDMPLSGEGRAEAASLKPLIDQYRFDRIVSSPYKRALQTAGIYADGLQIPLETHRGLRELDHGRWEGQRIDTLMRTLASGYRDWVRDPTCIPIPGGSESVTEAQERVVRAVVEIAGSGSPGRILIVLHKHIRAILNCRLNGCDLTSFETFIEESTTPQPIPDEQLYRICSTYWSCSTSGHSGLSGSDDAH